MDKKISLIIFLAGLILFPFISQAAGFVPCGGEGEAPCQLCDFFVMLDTILDFVILRLTPVIATLMLVVGGVMFFFGGTSPETVKRGKDIIFAAILGLGIIYAAWLIVNTFFGFIGVADWTGLGSGWWTIDCPL